ncbi:hypothetical protein LMH87_009756 [Akanthomyces muscarius]|uniref:Uncharacterized protein n=1 Tax=Akanthomyces muscarius TaxID=2231603 RepID=A0A9W8QEK8_AKAMU|nr:hypothetical protein LMH87_009756 [Akanthomyces muscarius]KAJ4153261.1 hypothetical protein LMH87_009756 [Akanthomyces muscarius]
MGGALERALPLALTVFCGVAGGFYTFQPMLAPKEPLESTQNPEKPVNSRADDARATAPKAGDVKPT